MQENGLSCTNYQSTWLQDSLAGTNSKLEGIRTIESVYTALDNYTDQ